MELALDQGNAYTRMNGKRLKNPEVVYRLSIAERALRVNNLSIAFKDFTRFSSTCHSAD